MQGGHPGPDSLYEQDILVWSERQVALLRRLAAGERLNDAVDWPNVIEELEDVGRSQLTACESLLLQALVHLLKLHAWPGCRAADHWTSEVESFLSDARRRFTPSMRQRIDLPDLYSDALYRTKPRPLDGIDPRPLPQACPYTLDDLLTRRPDVTDLVARLAHPASGDP